jgi:hypothetical protein
VSVTLGIPDTSPDASAYRAAQFTTVIWHKNRNFDRPFEPGYDPGNLYRAGDVLTEADTELWAEWYINDQAGWVSDWLNTVPAGPNPVRVPIRWTIGQGNWTRLLEETATAGRYVKLDMRKCAGSVGDDIFNSTTGVFDPDRGIGGTAQTGQGLVAALVLPDTVTEIKADSIGVFYNFSNLASLSGDGVEQLYDYAFDRVASLTSASFPNVTDIGGHAFRETGLVRADFPKAVTIGDTAFISCADLIRADFPKAVNIGSAAFGMCTSLEEVHFPLAERIGTNAFNNCDSLEEVEFPGVTESIGDDAFNFCDRLRSVSFPNLSGTIRRGAFYDCPSLETVNIPKVGTILNYAFSYCPVLRVITMGATPPVLGGNNHFLGTTPAAFTIRVPAGNRGAYETWKGTTYPGSFNAPGSVIIEEY